MSKYVSLRAKITSRLEDIESGRAKKREEQRMDAYKRQQQLESNNNSSSCPQAAVSDAGCGDGGARFRIPGVFE